MTSPALPATVARGGMPVAARIALAVIGLVVVIGIGADRLAPFGYDDQDLALRLRPPALLGGPAGHWLGTDELGRDVLSRLLFSIRISLATALAGTAVAACLGTAVGVLAARCGGLVEEALMLLADAQASLPFLILALASLAFFGNSLLLFGLLLGLNGWDSYARVARGLVLSTQALPYVEAIRLLGARPWRVYGRHVLPAIAGVLVVKVTLNFPATILLESGLSFLGLGVQPPTASWGSMVADGREHLFDAWWVATMPGLAILALVLAINLLGQSLRDAFDPRLRR